MKKSACYSAVALSLLLAGQAMAAAPSATLKVAGQFADGKCQVTLSGNSGELNWEGLSPSILKQNNAVQLPSKTKNVSVSCEQSSALSFRVIDNRKGTADVPNPTHFGLGNVNQTGKAGRYLATATQAFVDGQMVGIAAAGSASSAAHYFIPDEVAYWSPTGGNAIKLGKNFSFDLNIHPYLASINNMGGVPSDGDNLLDGSMTLEFGFGV